MINKWHITPKDWISISASLVQCNFDYVAYNIVNTHDEAETEAKV